MLVGTTHRKPDNLVSRVQVSFGQRQDRWALRTRLEARVSRDAQNVCAVTIVGIVLNWSGVDEYHVILLTGCYGKIVPLGNFIFYKLHTGICSLSVASVSSRNSNIRFVILSEEAWLVISLAVFSPFIFFHRFSSFFFFLICKCCVYGKINIVLHCIVLYCIVLYCIVLYCIVLYCIVLYCIVSNCIVLYWIVLALW